MAKQSSRQVRQANSSYWLTYSDLLSGLLLMFILLMMLALWNFQNANKDLIDEKDRYQQMIQENAEMKEKIERTVGVRAELIQDLTMQLQKNNINAVISETGAIKVDETILFEFGRSELKPEGRAFLNRFISVYLGVLSQDKYKDQVKEIIIEGHTDSVGDYLDNLDLSQARAISVAKYCMSQESGLDTAMRDYLEYFLTANGRSESRPVITNNEEDQNKSRRVEFLFRLSDEETIDWINQWVQEQEQSAVQAEQTGN